MKYRNRYGISLCESEMTRVNSDFGGVEPVVHRAA